MPKPTKLHAKGRPKSIQKSFKVDNDSPESENPDDSRRQFQLELCWCIQELERSLNEKKGNEKQMQEAWKVLTVLKNNNQPIIRKRQLMRTHFGDYRAKMAAEEKKLAKMASKMKITGTSAKPKATFLRKSAFLTTGDNLFRFNFNLSPDRFDNGNPLINLEGNTNKSHGVTKIKSDAEGKSVTDDTRRFKFTFSDSEFKFNFNTDK